MAGLLVRPVDQVDLRIAVLAQGQGDPLAVRGPGAGDVDAAAERCPGLDAGKELPAVEVGIPLLVGGVDQLPAVGGEVGVQVDGTVRGEALEVEPVVIHQVELLVPGRLGDKGNLAGEGTALPRDDQQHVVAHDLASGDPLLPAVADDERPRTGHIAERLECAFGLLFLVERNRDDDKDKTE